jgi:hypothetical protein
VPPPARTVKGKTSFQAPIGVGAHGFCRGRKGHLIFGSFVLPGIHMILSLIVFFALERNMSSTPFPNTLPIAGRLDVAVGLLNTFYVEIQEPAKLLLVWIGSASLPFFSFHRRGKLGAVYKLAHNGEGASVLQIGPKTTAEESWRSTNWPTTERKPPFYKLAQILPYRLLAALTWR